MGDIADQMLEGDICELCTEFLGYGAGYPRKCAACIAAEQKDKKHRSKKAAANKRNQLARIDRRSKK